MHQTNLMDILIYIIPLVIGIAIGFFIGRNRSSIPHETNTSEQNQLTNANQQLRQELNEALQKIARLEARLEAAQENQYEQKQEMSLLKDRIKELLDENRTLNGQIIQAETTNQQLKKQQKEIEDIREKFTQEFETISLRLLKTNSQELSKNNREKLDEILSPFQKQIDKFEKQVREAFENEGKDKASLKTEIQQLVQLNQKLSADAKNLTNALKGDTKKQGNWGEIILERILERSGLKKGEEYAAQYSTQNSEGQTIRPDVLVKLPDEKHIIIDSKVSLTAYERFVNSEDLSEQEAALKAHTTSIRKHVNDLSGKNYQTGEGLNTPDFVLLFMPIESAFSLAVQNDADLFNFAWEKRIVIVSPTTLLATLKTIASIWKQERQNQNVQEIARLGGEIHDKLVRTMAEFEKIDEDFGKMHEKYRDAKKRLYSGRGNVLNTALKMQELGAKNKKSFSTKLIDEIEDANE